MSIDKLGVVGANDRNVPSQEKVDTSDITKGKSYSSLSTESVHASVKPEIGSVNEAQELGDSLVKKLSESQDQAFNAVGSLDEARVNELLEE